MKSAGPFGSSADTVGINARSFDPALRIDERHSTNPGVEARGDAVIETGPRANAVRRSIAVRHFALATRTRRSNPTSDKSRPTAENAPKAETLLVLTAEIPRVVVDEIHREGRALGCTSGGDRRRNRSTESRHQV